MNSKSDRTLNQFWDDFVERRPLPSELDPQSARAITELHSLNTAPLPDSARERARQRIFASDAQSQESAMSTLVLQPPSVNGRSALSPPVPFPTVPSVPKPPILSRRALLSLAAAILIAFAGFGGYLAEQRYLRRRPVPSASRHPGTAGHARATAGCICRMDQHSRRCRAHRSRRRWSNRRTRRTVARPTRRRVPQFSSGGCRNRLHRLWRKHIDCIRHVQWPGALAVHR